MSDPELPEDRNLSNRIASTVFLALLAIPFANEGAKRVLNGEYLYSGIAFIIAFVSAAVAPRRGGSRDRRQTPGDWFVADSALEENGFEPSVPPEKGPTSSRCSTFPALPFREGPRVRIRLTTSASPRETVARMRPSLLALRDSLFKSRL